MNGPTVSAVSITLTGTLKTCYLGMQAFKTDVDLIDNVRKENCEKSFSTLVQKYENLFYRICHKYSSYLANNGIDVQDVLADKDYIIWSCCINFDPSKKTKFSTHVANTAKFTCLNFANKRKSFNLLNIDDEEILSHVEENCIVGSEKIDYSEMIQFEISRIKDCRARRILKLKYLSDEKMTWRQISEKMNISVQTSIGLHKKALKLLKNRIKI